VLALAADAERCRPARIRHRAHRCFQRQERGWRRVSVPYS
jgi:hypothetical protein